MSGYTDQSGNPVTFDELVTQVSESVLANVIALELAGVPRDEIKMVVGRDGGTVIGAGAMFQTPLVTPLSTEQGKVLYDEFAQLFTDYRQGSLDAEQLAQIRGRNNVDNKIDAIRQSLESQG